MANMRKWESISKNNVVHCPKCGKDKIRIATTVDEVRVQDGDRSSPSVYWAVDEPGSVFYTCLNKKCEHSWEE